MNYECDCWVLMSQIRRCGRVSPLVFSGSTVSRRTYGRDSCQRMRGTTSDRTLASRSCDAVSTCTSASFTLAGIATRSGPARASTVEGTRSSSCSVCAADGWVSMGRHYHQQRSRLGLAVALPLRTRRQTRRIQISLIVLSAAIDDGAAHHPARLI